MVNQRMTNCWPICSSIWQVANSSHVMPILMPSADVTRGISGVSLSRGGRTAHLKVRRMNSFVAFDFWTDPTDRTSYPMIVKKRNWGPLKGFFLIDKCQLHINKLPREREPCEYVNYPWVSSKCFLAAEQTSQVGIHVSENALEYSCRVLIFLRKGERLHVLEKAPLSHIRLLRDRFPYAFDALGLSIT